jgi:hypothetical protein
MPRATPPTRPFEPAPDGAKPPPFGGVVAIDVEEGLDDF